MVRSLEKDFDINNERYIIFASDEPEEYTKEFLNKCSIGFKVLQGRYKGENETSYIINKHNEYVIAPLVEQQESILELSEVAKNGMRKALIKLHTGQVSLLGNFEHVTKQEAENCEGYTYDPSTETYFVAR